MGIELIALGAGLAGSAFSAAGAMGQASSQREITALQMREQEQQRMLMERQFERNRREQMRQMQQARAMALTTASSQGAQFGSGLAGAYGGISGAAGNNLLGLSQGIEAGREVADINQQISQERMQMANWGMVSGIGGGLSSLGGSLTTSVPAWNRLTNQGTQSPFTHFGGAQNSWTSYNKYG